MLTKSSVTPVRDARQPGLRWEAIDLDAGTVRVLRVAAEINGHITIKPYPKSRAGRREIPLPGFAVELLTAHRETFPAGPLGEVFTVRSVASQVLPDRFPGKDMIIG